MDYFNNWGGGNWDFNLPKQSPNMNLSPATQNSPMAMPGAFSLPGAMQAMTPDPSLVSQPPPAPVPIMEPDPSLVSEPRPGSNAAMFARATQTPAPSGGVSFGGLGGNTLKSQPTIQGNTMQSLLGSGPAKPMPAPAPGSGAFSNATPMRMEQVAQAAQQAPPAPVQMQSTGDYTPYQQQPTSQAPGPRTGLWYNQNPSRVSSARSPSNGPAQMGGK